jgi:CelD/BcsL family acetyltransferase involved in cellulose biosynthesis
VRPDMPGATEWIEDADRFAALREEWEDLAQLDPSPFMRHDWLSAWWSAFGGGAAQRVLTVRDGDRLTAALPLLRRGRRLAAMANEHTPTFRPLVRDRSARRALVAALLGAGEPVELPALPMGEPEVAELIPALEGGGARTLVEPDYVSPITETRGGFEGYRARMKSGWKEIERRGRKLRREHEAEESLVAPPADLDRELDEGFALEASGWKGEAGTAILAAEETAGFYRDVARRFHERGELRLSSLRVDGRLVAFDLALLHRERYFLLKTAYDEGLRSLAPGLVMRRAVVERCFELGLEAHEFLGPDMEWKRLFATGDRPHAVCRAYPRGPLSTARYAYRGHLRPRLKRAYRAVRPRRPARAAG